MPADSTDPIGMEASDLSGEAASLLPVRMLNEYVYCPRLFHLMHVEGRWADNQYTIEGRHIHRRVDQLDHVLPDAVAAGGFADEKASASASHASEGKGEEDGNAETSDSVSHAKSSAKAKPAGDEPPVITRSVPLSSDSLHLTAKLDLVSSDGSEAVPVETKRGRVPNNPERSWEPERVQLMAQGLLLREQGYACDHGVLYFAGSRTRVDVPFTAELEADTLRYLREAHLASQSTILPPPLDDSPKCNGCSLNGICMPDETLALAAVPLDKQRPDVRRMYPAREYATPMYVQEQGASVGKSNSRLIVRKDREPIAEARLKDVSQLVLCGNVQVSTQTIHLLCEANVPVVYLSTGHWFSGITFGQGLRNAYDRAAQFRVAADPQACLQFARRLVADKAGNQRSLLRRNASVPDRVLDDLAQLPKRVDQAHSLEELLGLEGSIAAIYFQHFALMLKPRDFDANWDFTHRNRRPPRDPVNAMLSFGYALLAKECTVALLSEGLDPWWGFYHQPRHGRPSLALDIMEPFRATIVDSAVITAINTGMLQNRNFTRSAAGCILQPAGRKSFLQAYESRLDQLVTHPVFDYRCSWRSIIRLQARLLARWLRGDVPEYTSLVTR